MNLLLFHEFHNPSNKMFWLFHLNIKNFQLAKRRKHHYQKPFSYLILWKPLTIYRKNSRQPKFRLKHSSSLCDKKLVWRLGNSLHASLAEMLSFCLKAWVLLKCLPSPGWVKTISFSLIAAELKWRIIYLNFWSMKQNAASMHHVCPRNHKSEGRVDKAFGQQGGSHFLM